MSEMAGGTGENEAIGAGASSGAGSDLTSFYEAIVESSDDAIVGLGSDGIILSWNPAAERLFGYSEEEAVGKSVFITVEEELEAELRGMLDRIARGEHVRHYETERIRKGGGRIDVSISLSPIHGPDGKVVGASKIARDLSERRRFEERLQLALDAARLGQWHLDFRTNRFSSSDQCKANFGRAPQATEFTFDDFLAAIHPDDREAVRKAVATAVERRSEYDAEYRVVWPDGSPHWVSARGRIAYAEDGTPMSMDGITSDVTERRRSEASKRESEDRLRALTDNLPDGAIYQVRREVNGQTRFTFVSAGVERLFGVSADAALADPAALYGTIHEADRARVIATEADSLRTLQRFDCEFRHAMPSGEVRWVHARSAPRRLPDGETVWEGVLTDATDRKRTDAALRDSEEQFRQLADAMPQIVWTARSDGEIDYFNRRWYEFTGSQETVGNAAWREILHSEDAPSARERWATSLQNGEPFEMEVRLRDRRRQTHRWHLIRTVAVRDDIGAVVRWFGTATDIHEQKRSEESARYLAEASAALASVVDYESTLQRVANLAVPYFADWSAVDVVNPDGTLRRLAVSHQDPEKVRLAHELMQEYPPDPASETGAFAVIRTGKREIVSEIPDELLVRATKDERHLELIRSLGLRSFICVPLVVSGVPMGVLTFATAESGRTYTEADLALADDLAHRAGVAIENTRLYQALREADRRKDEFLATLAHELRNPLAPIHSAVQLMRMAGSQDSETQETLDIVERQVTHIIRLVDDLMEISRIARGKIELRRERIDLAEVARNAVETSRPQVDACRHSLTVFVPPRPVFVMGDAVRLAQVVTNLLNNAAKFTQHDGRIELHVGTHRGEAQIRVRDSGCGISPELLPRVFDLFVQGSAARDAQGGLGIGLALVKQIVELHGGSVEAHSEGAGRGCEFIARLPALADQEGLHDPSKPRSDQKATSSRRVLVADDNVPAAKLLAAMLKALGHEVAIAHDGQEAIEAGETFRPDLILMDLGMPRVDGWEAARLVRQRPWGRDLHLVALTGWGQEEDRRRTKLAGFDGHYVKPLELEKLRSLLASSSPPRLDADST